MREVSIAGIGCMGWPGGRKRERGQPLGHICAGIDDAVGDLGLEGGFREVFLVQKTEDNFKSLTNSQKLGGCMTWTIC